MNFLEEISIMTFARPLLLLLLVIPVTLAFWEWVRKGHPLVMPFDHGHQKRSRWLGRLVAIANLISSAAEDALTLAESAGDPAEGKS